MVEDNWNAHNRGAGDSDENEGESRIPCRIDDRVAK